LARIEVVDLLRFAALAADAEAGLFGRNPHGSGRYAGRLLGRALCQGAALHCVSKKNGVKDFDAQYDDWPFPARWRGTRDFGPSKFGSDSARRSADLRQVEISQALAARQRIDAWHRSRSVTKAR
jgi:hypothetical protein